MALIRLRAYTTKLNKCGKTWTKDQRWKWTKWPWWKSWLWDKYFGIVDYTTVWVASETCATIVTKMLVAMVNVPWFTIDRGWSWLVAVGRCWSWLVAVDRGWSWLIVDWSTPRRLSDDSLYMIMSFVIYRVRIRFKVWKRLQIWCVLLCVLLVFHIDGTANTRTPFQTRSCGVPDRKHA